METQPQPKKLNVFLLGIMFFLARLLFTSQFMTDLLQKIKEIDNDQTMDSVEKYNAVWDYIQLKWKDIEGRFPNWALNLAIEIAVAWQKRQKQV